MEETTFSLISEIKYFTSFIKKPLILKLWPNYNLFGFLNIISYSKGIKKN